MSPIVVGFDADGTDGWNMESTLPGKGKMLLFIEVNLKDGTTEKLSGIPLLSTIEIPNLFDAREKKVGDAIVDWTITTYDIQPDSAIGFSGIVQFEGQKKLSGTFKHVPETDEFMGLNVCFTPDSQSAEELPKMLGDLRNTFFCVSNYEEISELFGEPGTEGEATIVIEDYVLDYRPTEAWNLAKVIKVENIEAN